MDTIEDGAIFVADAHYPHHDKGYFLKLLSSIESKHIQTPQLFLMGDNFDLLFGHNRLILRHNQEAIARINAICKLIPVYIFEGNHDFCLKSVFRNATVVPYTKQPLGFWYHQKKIALAHGDRFDTPLSYKIYTYILRNRLTLTLLRPWEKPIIQKQLRHLQSKKPCTTFKNFEQKVARIMQHYRDYDLVIEGHFHQGTRIDNYIALPSLACQHKIAKAQHNTFKFIDLE